MLPAARPVGGLRVGRRGLPAARPLCALCVLVRTSHQSGSPPTKRSLDWRFCRGSAAGGPVCCPSAMPAGPTRRQWPLRTLWYCILVGRPIGDKQKFPLRSNGRRRGTFSLLSCLFPEKRGTAGVFDDGRRSSQGRNVALSAPRGGACSWFHPAWTLGRVRVQFRCKVRGARAAAAPRSLVGAAHGGWVGASSPMTSPHAVPGLAATGRAGACVCTPRAGPTPARAGPGLVLGALGQLACAPWRARTSGVAF